MTTLSTRICVKTSKKVAPMALRMPISRTRSVMLASMMFMMPMPPTSRLIAAMMPPLMRALLDGLGDAFGPVLLRAEGEVLDALVRVHEDVLRLLQRLVHFVDVGDLDRERGEARIGNELGVAALPLRIAAAGLLELLPLLRLPPDEELPLPRCAGRRAEAQPHRVERDVDGVVLQVEDEAARRAAAALAAAHAPVAAAPLGPALLVSTGLRGLQSARSFLSCSLS